MRKIIIPIAILAVLAVVFVIYQALQTPSGSSLSDEQLLAYAKSPFNKREMMFKDVMIGYHNGVPVRVTFPCSDVCPQYTMRIIRYNVSLSDCGAAGGETKAILVPFAIGGRAEEFCFPKIIVENGIYEFIEK